MPGPVVDVDPRDLQRIVAAIQRAQVDVDRAAKSMQSALRSARWNDSQRVKFEVMLKESNRKLAGFSSDGQEMQAFLKKLIAIAEQFRNA